MVVLKTPCYSLLDSSLSSSMPSSFRSTQEETWDNIPHQHDISVAMDQNRCSSTVLFVNNIGLLSLIGFIMVFTQVRKISGGGSSPAIFTSIGAC